MASASKKVEKFIDKSYQNGFMKTIDKLRQNEELTDVTVQSGDVQIQCHRIVLAAGSDYFKAMFRCGLQEGASDTVQVTMEPVIMTSIIDYIYTGEIELTIDNVANVVRACDVLQLDALKAGCEDFMVSQVDLNNCVEFFRCATSFRLCKVQRKAKELMLAEFKTVAFTDEFKELCCSDLIAFIKEDDINVDDEDAIVECVLDWVRHDLPNRKASLETVFEYVRLPHCTGHYLRHLKDKCDLLTPKCVEYLNEATSFQVDPVHQNEISSCRTVPRTHFRVKSRLLVVGGVTLSKDNTVVNNNGCQYYNETTNCWETVSEMPKSIDRLYSVCHVGGSLLLTGGHKGGVAVDQCWLYDFNTKKWETMPPLITARYFHRSVSLGNCVYVVGGWDAGDKTLSSVECLNLTQRKWSSMPNMAQAVYYPMIATYCNKIFVLGGVDAQNTSLRCTQEFDTTRRKWSALPDMPVACSRTGAVTLNDAIYVVGSTNRTCLKYEPAKRTWTRLNQPRDSHENAAVVVWRGCILVAGGGGPDPESSVIEQYDPLTDTWSRWKSELSAKLEAHDMFNVALCDV